MHWQLEITREEGTIALHLRGSSTPPLIRTWRGRFAHRILASGVLPRSLLTPGRHDCDKKLVREILLKAATVCTHRPPGDTADGARLEQRLQAHGIRPTRARLLTARALYATPGHPTADEVWHTIRARGAHCARASVYNTLSRMAERGMIKSLPVAPGRTHYDTVTAPHPHLYNVDTGEIRDLHGTRIPPVPLPRLPPGTRLEDIDMIVRVRGPALGVRG